MTVRTIAPPRRGACPGLSAPMPTGDGLLVRFHPIGTIPLTAFAALCRAARRHGNGVIEITSRGSIQVRGLRDQTAQQFAADVAALDIAADDHVPVLCNPLAGIDAEEICDSAALAAELRRALAQRAMPKLSQKVSIAVDGGGALSLANLSADVRLCAAHKTNGDVTLGVSVGGDQKSATDLGNVDLECGVEAVVRLLDVIAQHGGMSRARDLIIAKGDSAFRAALAGMLFPARRFEGGLSGNEPDVIGPHSLRDRSFACGIGLAFGHSDATTLEQLAEAANAGGAIGFRAAPGRALLAIGLAREKSDFSATAEKLGFITCTGDPRRHVIACAGAPVCASAYIASRALAPLIAGKTRYTVHISGCAKGCAHAGPAALTVVGTPEGCALVTNGTARDTPFAVVPTDELLTALAKFARQKTHEAAHV